MIINEIEKCIKCINVLIYIYICIYIYTDIYHTNKHTNNPALLKRRAVASPGDVNLRVIEIHLGVSIIDVLLHPDIAFVAGCTGENVFAIDVRIGGGVRYRHRIALTCIDPW